MRVDAFDAETGILRRSVTFPAAPALISVDADGELWRARADTLDAISTPPPRPIVDFDLPTLRGDTLSLRAFRGKVVLLNIWASWCDPCRDEFPLLAGLARERAGNDFAIIGVSDDVDEGKAQRFVAELEPPYAIALGHSALKRQLNYRGIPFTVLLDREGRVIERYIGFGGERQFERLRADVQAAMEKRGRPD
jgi:thiol-disulfide isomerase/thioredoxin